MMTPCLSVFVQKLFHLIRCYDIEQIERCHKGSLLQVIEVGAAVISQKLPVQTQSIDWLFERMQAARLTD